MSDAPMADGSVLVDRLDICSAGTGGWHAGEPMDPRARAVLERRGYVDHGHRARPFETKWFEATDLIVCMDRGHQQTLLSLARGKAGDKRYDERLVWRRLTAGRWCGRRAGPVLRTTPAEAWWPCGVRVPWGPSTTGSPGPSSR
jgi:hypothetical protein